MYLKNYDISCLITLALKNSLFWYYIKQIMNVSIRAMACHWIMYVLCILYSLTNSLIQIQIRGKMECSIKLGYRLKNTQKNKYR